MSRRKNKQSRKYIPMNEFRYSESKLYNDHPQYIFGKTRSGKYKSLGLTHNPDEKHPVVGLSKSPNPRDKKKAYIGTNPHTLREKDLDKMPKQDWRFAENDKPVVRHIIKTYKKRTNRNSTKKHKKRNEPFVR